MAACLTCLMSGPATGDSAAGFDPYVIEDLRISVSAEDAVRAKDKALAQAVGDGLERVLRRVTAAAERARLPEPGEALAHRLLDRLSIEAERVGPTSYAARFRVMFSPLAVRGFLGEHGARAVDQPAPPVLLIPVLVEDATPVMWEAARSWTEALADIAFEDGLTPVRLPDNTRADRAVRSEQLLAANQATLGSFRVRYRTQGVVAVRAEMERGGDRVGLRLVGEDAAGPVDIEADVAAGGLAAAAERVAALLSERWKSAVAGTLAQAEPESSGLAVRVLLHGGRAEWAEIQRRLAASGQVRGLAVEHEGSRSVDVTLWHSGGPRRLAERLAGHGLDLFEAGGSWLLQSY